MLREQVFQNPHLAGRVKRYHTWPTFHTQTVGEHTWQLLRLHCQMFGPPTPLVTEYIVWHDAGELVTGDPPFPLKANNPALKTIYDALEHVAVENMGGQTIVLSESEKIKVKLCDLMEMYEFGSVEYCMGNKFAEPIIVDTRAAMEALIGRLERRDFEGYLAYWNKNLHWHGTRSD